MVNKVDSNMTGLAFAEETSLGVLPVTPDWYSLEPNSYSDFGGEIATVARNPINNTRQRKKGVTTDLDASGGFNQDLTFSNTTRLLQGFFFASIREKPTTWPMNGARVAQTAILAANDDYTAAAGFPVTIISGNLLWASGFGVAANNGLKTSNATSTGIAISVSDALSDEPAPPATSKVEVVGHQLGAATSAIAMVGTLVTLTDSGNPFVTLGLIAGEWIWVGGDSATLRFANNIGWARIMTVAAGVLTFDKVSWAAPVNEASAGKTIQIFYGNIVRNEPLTANIVRRTYNVERQLGNDGSGTMSEYLVGAVANELTINMQQADKITIDLSFVATNNEQRSGVTGVKSGNRPTRVAEGAYNTTSHATRVKLSSVSVVNSNVTPLFAYATDFTLTINNNVTPNKAIGVLGAFDVSAGTFEVGGELTCYFADVAGVAAVRSNADITLDFILARDNQGILFDIPLLALGNGRLTVEQDQAIMLPLENQAAQSNYGYTLLFESFTYLPTLAMPA